jgi:hypothetical protein
VNADHQIELHGREYRIGRLDVFAQFDVSRRVGPFAPALFPVFKELAKTAGEQGGAPNVDALMIAAQPFLDALARMSNEDSRFVLSTCLSVVKLRQGDKWSTIFNRDAGVVMFDDLDLSTIGPLVVHVIKDNLGPFFSGWLTAQTTPASTKAA